MSNVTEKPVVYEIDINLVSESRGRFFTQKDNNGNQFDEKDINNLRKNDINLRKFLESMHGNVDRA